MKSEQPTIDPAILEEARTQAGQSLAELSRERPQLVVFLRHIGCTFCRQALGDLAKQRATISASGTGIVVVHMESEALAAGLFERYGMGDVPRISDPQRRLYEAAGVPRGNLLQVAGPDVWLPGLASLLTGHIPTVPTSDVFQLPGAILLKDGKVLRSFYSKTSAERADYCALAETFPAAL